MTKEIFAANLKELRKRAGWTQQDFADALGVKRHSIGAWEDGRALPKMSMFIKLCDYLGNKDIYKLVTTPLR